MFAAIIVGRPNVGKSTLFNKLVGAQEAITHNLSGITRDYKISKINLGNLNFELIDTAGLYLTKKLSDLEKKFNNQTKLALTKANVILFVVDGKEGITEEDRFISKFLRKYSLPTLLILNKSDCKILEQNVSDFFELGYKKTCKISAEHSIGTNYIFNYLLDLHIHSPKETDNLEGELSNIESKKDNSLKIAIIGRPNAGKSTFINNLLNEERLVTGPEPGITRDSINIDFKYKDFQIEFTDTAGIRKKRNITKETVEKLSVSQTIHSIDAADVSVLLVDINNFLETQDLKIANLAISRGKPIILAVNKKDSIKNKVVMNKIIEEISYLVQKKLSDIKSLPIVYISAVNKSNLTKVIDQCIKQYQLWNTRIPTAKLNIWIEYIVENHRPPLSKRGKVIKIKYISQIKVAPPTFKLFTNNPNEIPTHYIKYLSNQLAETFELQGIPIRIIKDKSPNPYK